MQYKKETHQSRNEVVKKCFYYIQYTYPYGNVIRVANVYHWLGFGSMGVVTKHGWSGGYTCFGINFS